uniref:Uncharacterized protein n=1 Tax=Podoviridae sp. ct2m58 TaxID=2827721 RepID=A0A8S5TMJ0_9CAUD|nr:MAG TPA: hypothetical protein [Podoviridae sp. ct2m58]
MPFLILISLFGTLQHLSVSIILFRASFFDVQVLSWHLRFHVFV